MAQLKKNTNSINISKSNDRELLKSIISEIKKIKSSQKNKNHKDELDLNLLKASQLIINHYESVSRNNRKYLLSQVTSWAAFPVDWSTRKDSDNFSLDEIMFLFIKKIIFHINEIKLKELRASIIDCPGIQASKIGSTIARQIISSSHAIIVLLGADGRGVSEDTLDDLEDFKDLGLKSGILWAVNARGVNRKIMIERIVPNDIAKLRNKGFIVDDNMVSVFNGLLAYRIKQFYLIRDSDIPDEDINKLSEKAMLEYDVELLPENGAKPLQNALYLIERDIKRTYEQFSGRERPSKITDSFVEEADFFSNWEKTTETTVSFILSRKSRAILIDQGAGIILHNLEQERNNLISLEESSLKSAEDLKREARKLEKELLVFDQQAQEIVKETKLYLEEDAKKYLVSEIGNILQDNTEELKSLLKKKIDELKRHRYLDGELRKISLDFISKKIIGWATNVSSGDTDAIKNINKDIQKIIDKIKAAANSHGFKLPSVFFNFSFDWESFDDNMKRFLDDFFLAELSPNFWQQGGNILENASEIFDLKSVVVDFRKWFNVDFLGKTSEFKITVDEMAPEIQKGAVNLAKKLLEPQLDNYNESFANSILFAVDENRVFVHKKIRQMKETINAEHQAKHLIMINAKTKREKHIEPVIEKVMDFMDRVELELS